MSNKIATSNLPWHNRSAQLICHNHGGQMLIEREFAKSIKKDLEKKIVILSGPRQVGKTTLSKSLFPQFQYLNFDNAEHQSILLKKSWDRSQDLIIFDEIHKMDQWKRWLKGIFDTEGVRPRILVTGSARLETLSNVGDSLAGRFFSYRLHPFTIEELKKSGYKEQNNELLKRLLEYSGFPEPFLESNKRFYGRWQKSHLDTILREDLISLLEIKNIHKLKTLILLLRERIGSPLSYSSIAQDLGTTYKTVQSWVSLLEKLYIIFKITPYHRNIARSLLKEPKYYFYNLGVVTGEGERFENLIALALLKKAHELSDVYGEESSLYYLRNRDGKEVDFLLTREGEHLLVEAKLSDAQPSKHLRHFSKFFHHAKKVQVVRDLKIAQSTSDGIFICSAQNWLTDPLSKP